MPIFDLRLAMNYIQTSIISARVCVGFKYMCKLTATLDSGSECSIRASIHVAQEVTYQRFGIMTRLMDVSIALLHIN